MLEGIITLYLDKSSLSELSSSSFKVDYRIADP
jgi:hypothetical protein